MLSRSDSATIASAEWVKDPKKLDLYWWTIKTDKTGDTPITTIGMSPGQNNMSEPPPEGDKSFTLGRTIRLGELSFAPVPAGLMAYSKSERGIVLSTIGRITDQLERICGPMAYLVPRCKTRRDTVDPTTKQMEALRGALAILMTKGVRDAKVYLEKTGLFDNVFEGGEGCPACPGSLTDGVFEWRQ